MSPTCMAKEGRERSPTWYLVPAAVPHDSLTEPLVLVEGVQGGECLPTLVTLDLLPTVSMHSLVAAQV